jgi:DNA-nicking Smr family endonuclease
MARPGYSRAVGKKPFHGPFRDLKRMLEERARATPPRPAGTGPGSGGRDVPAAPGPEPVPADDDLWAQATAGVSRLERGPGVADPLPPAPGPRQVRHPDLDAVDELRALVDGDAPFDLSDSDEFIEGCVAGLDPAVVRKLRRGDYAVQGHVDLHGLRRDEAKAAVDRFLRDARAAGKRCVLLVHGRGSHSKDQVPVLKDALRTWLATARFGRYVLAFATARPQDGGAGAVYVLLRRAGR